MHNEKKPFGRQEVVEALIASAAELFARHGVNGVSLRTITKHAGVNLGLLHRHIGTKENLYRLTLEHLAKEIAVEIPANANLLEGIRHAFTSLERHAQFWRLLARTLLDGVQPEDLHTNYPVADHLLGLARQALKEGSLTEDIDPRFLVATMFAFSLGFQLFEPFILRATSLEGLDPEDVRNRIVKTAAALLRPRGEL
jgi:AcrR family transcriptional regulator